MESTSASAICIQFTANLTLLHQSGSHSVVQIARVGCVAEKIRNHGASRQKRRFDFLPVRTVATDSGDEGALPIDARNEQVGIRSAREFTYHPVALVGIRISRTAILEQVGRAGVHQDPTRSTRMTDHRGEHAQGYIIDRTSNARPPPNRKTRERPHALR